MKGFKVLVILVLLAAGCFSAVNAEVRHISVNNMPFKSGSLPKLTVNIDTDQDDLSRLTFYLRQIYQDNIVLEKLSVERRDHDVFVLSGTEKIRDQDASLIVSEYLNTKWLQYSPVPLFSRVVALSENQPVAIKTMKSPSAELLTSTVEPTNHNTSAASVLPNINDCKVIELPDDTLWKVATRHHKQWGANIYGAMLALYYTNPSAFSRGRIRFLKQGHSLNCPSEDMLSQYQSVTADKATFDDLVASQTTSGKVSPTSMVNQSQQPETMKADDSTAAVLDNKMIESEPLLAIHEATVSSQQTQVNDITHSPIDVQSENHDTTCTIDKSPEDTLWRIASRYYQQWDSNIFGAMLAIYDANPKAFASKKIYLLMSDRRLKCPSKQILMKYQSPSKDQATYEALEQLHRQL